MAAGALPPEELARQLGIADTPAAWGRHWPAFSDWVSGGKCEARHWRLPEKAAEVFDLPAECLDSLQAVYAAIRGDSRLIQLADFWHYVLYHLPGDIGGTPDTWPAPEGLLGAPARLFALAMMVSGADHALDNFAAAGVSDEITRATLGYIGRFARDIKDRRGVWGLEAMAWLRNYVRAKIFRLGRLTFMAGRFGWAFRAYRSRRTGEVVALAESSRKYRRDGLADGTNGVFDPEAWTPVFEVGESSVTGCPVSSQCTALRRPVTLSTDEWEQVVAPGDDIVEVHIAGGSRLSPQECADAFRQAREFFPPRYPRSRFVAYTCGSWLLDPGLSRILPPESNIVRFQKLFHLLPVPGDERQAYDLVFGNPTADPATAPRTTRLRQAIADYVAAGNKMRSTAGFIPWDDAALAESPYPDCTEGTARDSPLPGERGKGEGPHILRAEGAR